MADRVRLGPYMVAEPLTNDPRGWWDITSTRSGALLGRLEWYARWRCYVLSAEPEVVWAPDCLRDVAGLCERLTAATRAATTADRP